MTDKEFAEKQSKIISGNTSIAKYMGWKIDNSFPDKGKVYRSSNNLELNTTMKFHYSWNLLMPVCNKIMSDFALKPLLKSEEWYKNIVNGLLTQDIKLVYDNVVLGIEILSSGTVNVTFTK